MVYDSIIVPRFLLSSTVCAMANVPHNINLSTTLKYFSKLFQIPTHYVYMKFIASNQFFPAIQMKFVTLTSKQNGPQIVVSNCTRTSISNWSGLDKMDTDDASGYSNGNIILHKTNISLKQVFIRHSRW